LLACVRALARR